MYNKDMLKSNIPLEMEKRNMTPQDLVKADVVSQGLAYKIASGSTNLQLETLNRLCDLFEVRFLDDLIEYIPEVK